MRGLKPWEIMMACPACGASLIAAPHNSDPKGTRVVECPCLSCIDDLTKCPPPRYFDRDGLEIAPPWAEADAR